MKTSPLQLARRIGKELCLIPYDLIDGLYRRYDRGLVQRTRNITRIPGSLRRRGGKRAYAEWAHVIGIFQTLIHQQLGANDRPAVLDVGCGSGLLAIAAEPFLGPDGRYTGLDVMKGEIDFCRGHYPSPPFEFIHFDTANAAYAPGQAAARPPWPLPDRAFDLVTALSVWTHMNEQDATFYVAEVARVLKPGGRAMITFFLLDDAYRRSLGRRDDGKGRYHNTRRSDWVFDQPSYASDAWFHPAWAHVPENAVAVTPDGLNRLLAASGLRLSEHHQGNWKETPGTYFQDVLIFRQD